MKQAEAASRSAAIIHPQKSSPAARNYRGRRRLQRSGGAPNEHRPVFAIQQLCNGATRSQQNASGEPQDMRRQSRRSRLQQRWRHGDAKRPRGLQDCFLIDFAFESSSACVAGL
jgi:hypothetical protein